MPVPLAVCVLACVLTAGAPVPSSAQSPSPAPAVVPPAALPDGQYQYRLSVRGASDTIATAVVARNAGGVVVETKDTPLYTSTFVIPGRSMVSTSARVYYHTTLRLDPQWDPLGEFLEVRRDQGASDFRGARFTETGADVFAPWRKFVAFAAGTEHALAFDGLNIGGVIVAPAALAAWGPGPVSAVSVLEARAVETTCAAASLPRPKDVPAADVAVQCSGRREPTFWYDPATFVPDVIELPSVGGRLVRFVPRT